jgi:hypothetical protein
VAARSTAFHYKIGGDAYGLLRPDKIVVHFYELESLHAAAKELAAKLNGCKAHGVPFTAQLIADGLISWGTDPAMDDRSNPWVERESWRGRICTRLASSLAVAKASPSSGISPKDFALQRLRLDGIDTETWSLSA